MKLYFASTSLILGVSLAAEVNTGGARAVLKHPGDNLSLHGINEAKRHLNEEPTMPDSCDCASKPRCRKNPASCECAHNKCRKREVHCKTRGKESENWGCSDGMECISKLNKKGKTRVWGRCKTLTTEAPTQIPSFAPDVCLTILLTNDDGYETLYINTLFAHLRDDTCHRVVMAAPKEGQSGMSAAINGFFSPIEIGNPSDDVYFVKSTPYTATLYGLDHVLPSLGIDAPDLVISGPNEGWNIGITTLNSGTVAAAAAAMQRGLPAIAVSGSIYDHESENAEEGALVIAKLVVKLVETKLIGEDGNLLLAGGEGLNVNIPSITNDDTGFVGALDDYAFQLTKIGSATPFGAKFYGDIGESSLGGLNDLSGWSGLSIEFHYTHAGYPLDTDPKSEGNAIGPVFSLSSNRAGEDPLYAVTVSPMEFTLETPALSLFDGEDQVPPPTHACLNILLTNDDGYETLYINTLFAHLRDDTCHRVVMAAPKEGQSGMSAAINGFFSPIEIGNPSDDVYFVKSTPYTATLYGLDHVLPSLGIDAPDLVISGPNEGWNIGITTLNSGTVAAAAAAMQRGLPAIAVSGSIYDHESENAEEGALVIAKLVVKLVETKLIGEDGNLLLAGGEGLNVNIPSITNDDTGFVGALDDYAFQLTKIGSATPFGAKFYGDIGESSLGGLNDLSGWSGLSIEFHYTHAGYPLDTDPKSEGNAIGPVFSLSSNRAGEDPLYAVTVSPMEFTLETPAPALVQKAFETCNNDNDCLGVN